MMIEIKEGKFYIDDKDNIWRAGSNGCMSVCRRVDPEFAYPCRIREGNRLNGCPSYTIVAEWIKNPWHKDSTSYTNFEFFRSLKNGDILINRANCSVWCVQTVKIDFAAYIHVVALKGGDCSQKIITSWCDEASLLEKVDLSEWSVNREYRELITEYVRILDGDPRIEKFHKYIAVDDCGGFNTFMQEPTYDLIAKQWRTEDGMFRNIQCDSSFRNVAGSSKVKISSIRLTAELIKQSEQHPGVSELDLADGTHLKITIERTNNANN